MPEPLLHLGNVGLVIERIGGGRRSECAPISNPNPFEYSLTIL